MKKWRWVLVALAVIVLIILLLFGSGEKSVSNFYLIPAGTYSPLR